MPQGDCRVVLRTTVFGATGTTGPAGAGAGDDAGAEAVPAGVLVVEEGAATAVEAVEAAAAAAAVEAAAAAASAVAVEPSPVWVVSPPPHAVKATRQDARSALRPNLACRM
ncbi:MAG: hypothetical protein ACK5PW_16750 [Burkholderiales bacterium]|jgi:hypothetical protein